MSENNSLTVYRRLIHDKRILPGAFRLWHYLFDRRDKSGKCWPEQRTIARDLRCKTHSLRGWIFQLTSAGYLDVSKTGQNHHHVYQICFGDGHGGLPEWATRGKAQSVSCSPKAKAVSPPEATPRVAEKGDGSNANGVITKRNTTKNFFDLPVKKQKSLRAQLRAAAENPSKPCDVREEKKIKKKGALPGERSFVTALESGASENVLDKLSEPQTI